MGDRSKYGIEIYHAKMVFESDWTIKERYRFAPGIRRVVLKYLTDLESLGEEMPGYEPIGPGHLE